MFVGISSESASTPPSKTNPFVFSNGTQVKDTNTLVKWKKKHPYYHSTFQCVSLTAAGLEAGVCSATLVNSECEEECQMNNGSDRSRENLPVFAPFFGGQRLQGVLRARRACGVSLRASSCVLKLFFCICIGNLFFFCL